MDNMGSGLSAADVLALTRTNSNDGMGGTNFWWVIIFFIVAGMFNGNGFFGGSATGTVANDALLNQEFIKRDIFNTNQNVSNTSCQTQRDVLDSKYDLGMQTLENRYTNQLGLQELGSKMSSCCCETQKEIMQNRFDTAVGQASLQKDISLGLAGLQKDMLLVNKDMQAQMASCCCDLKTAIHAEGEATRALITENTIQELRDQLQVAQSALSNNNQTQNILNSIGRYNVVSVPPYNNYYPASYYGCGCGVSSVI